MEKSVLITGAGSGIGEAIATELAAKDFKLLLVGRNQKNLQATLEKTKNPSRHKLLSADVADGASLKKALAEAQVTNLHAVIANAGVGGVNTYGPGDRWGEVIGTNLTGSYNTVMEALPYLQREKSGFRHVVLISSILSRLGVPGYSAYCASKAGVLGLMRSMAAEFAPEKILVNAICPGWVNTEMARQGIEGFAKVTGQSYDKALATQMKPVPLGKMSEPAEIAALVSFLIGEHQTSITGQALDINNGALMV